MSIPPLKELVEMIPNSVLFLIFVSIFLGGCKVFTSIDVQTQAEKDFDEFVRHLNDAHWETLRYPLHTYENVHYWKLYAADDLGLPGSCKGKNCICLHKQGEDRHTDCKGVNDALVHGSPQVEIGQGNLKLFLSREDSVVTISLLDNI